MKIAMIGQKGIPAIYGGIEKHVEGLAKELGAAGHHVLVYARKWYVAEQKTARHPGVTVRLMPTIHTKHLDAVAHTLFSTIHALFQKPDVIHYHGVGPALLSWIPRVFAPRVKVVTTFHCIDRYHQKWGAIAKFCLRLGERAACAFAHQTIAVSRTIQNYCFNEYQTPTHYIPNGVELPGPVAYEPFREFGLKKGRYILMVSRLVAHKGAHYLLAAWDYACKQQPNLAEQFKLVIVGGSTFTDDYVEDLHMRAEHNPSVLFTNWQHGSALAALYAHAALLVHPSENEGLPLTVLEAMAHGKPVLLSDIPEHQELINDKHFLFEAASVGALADKLLTILPKIDQLGAAGAHNRTVVTERFSLRHIAERTARLYGTPKSVSVAKAALQVA